MGFMDTFKKANAEHITLGGQQFPRISWLKRPNLRTLYFLLTIPLVGSWAEGYDGSMMNGLQASTEWQDYFGHPTGSLLAFYNLSFAIGALAAVIPFPFGAFFADRIGRRGGIVVGALVTILGTILQAASQNFAMFVVARVILGLGVTIGQGNCPILITELSHPQHRAHMTAMYNSNWYFGSIIAAWVTFGTINIQNSWAWRIPSILQGGAALIMICFIWFVPESPRFLIANDRQDEALEILIKYHGEGLKTDFVAAEYLEIQETIALEKQYNTRGWGELLATPGNRYRTLLCFLQGFFSQWCGNGLISYYLVPVLSTVGITSSNEQAGLNGGLQIWNFIVALWAAFNIDRLGRRPMALGSTGAMVVIFVLWTVFSALYTENGQEGMATGVIVMIFLFYTAFNIGWQGLVIAYPVEILPYQIRAKGLQVTFFGVSTNIINQYVNPIGIENCGWRFYIFYNVFLLVIFTAVYFLWIETKGVPLEEIAKLFDGEDTALVGGGAATSTAVDKFADMKRRGVVNKTVLEVEYAEGDDTDIPNAGGEVVHRESVNATA